MLVFQMFIYIHLRKRIVVLFIKIELFVGDIVTKLFKVF